MSAKNTVSVVSKDASWASSLKAPFKSAGMNLTAFPTATDFLEALDADKPVNCIVSELSNAPDLMKELADNHCLIPVVLMAGSAGVIAAVQAIKAGAFDVVERTDALIDSAKRAAAYAGRYRQALEDKATAARRIDTLTKRENQVLHLMVEGKPNRLIAEELGISTKTLDIHRANLMDKMEARTTADMCRAYLLHKAHILHLPIIGG